MIEERYESLDDTSPHDQFLLILSESSRCFGSDFSDLSEEIKDNVVGSELSVYKCRHPLDDIDETSRLIQNSVWLIHWEDCLKDGNYPSLDTMLDRSMFPVYGEAIICTENGGREKGREIKNAYKGTSVVHSKDTLLSAAKMRLTDINPIHRSGREKLKNWNNEIWDRVN